MSTDQQNLDPPIRTGDIVYVNVSDIYHKEGGAKWNFVAMVHSITPGEGVNLDACGGHMKSVALDRCFHATEKQKAEYFKLVLQFGN